MICPACGAEIPVDAGFCRICGEIVRGRYASTPPAPPEPPRRSDRTPVPRGDQGLKYSSILDGAVTVGALAVIVSLGLSWYAASATVHGHVETITRHLLSGNFGIQRPLVPIVAAVTVIEVLANASLARRAQGEWSRHRAALVFFCALDLVLVVSSMLSSPLSPNRLSNLGISVNAGAGSYVALAGAAFAMFAASLRMFSGSPALGRSTASHFG